VRTWHGGGATHSARCPPASTGLAHRGTSAATGGEGGSGLLPCLRLRVGPPQFVLSRRWSGAGARARALNLVVIHARRVAAAAARGKRIQVVGGVDHSGVMGRLVSERSERCKAYPRCLGQAVFQEIKNGPHAI
jgi:hypothetical protein